MVVRSLDPCGHAAALKDAQDGNPEPKPVSERRTRRPQEPRAYAALAVLATLLAAAAVAGTLALAR